MGITMRRFQAWRETQPSRVCLSERCPKIGGLGLPQSRNAPLRADIACYHQGGTITSLLTVDPYANWSWQPMTGPERGLTCI